jgi:hypothetical protein
MIDTSIQKANVYTVYNFLEGRLKMNQPIPNSPQEAWLQVLGKGLVTFPERWWDELGVQNGTFVKAKKEGKRVIIETQAVEVVPSDNAEENLTVSIAQLKAAQQLERLYQFRNPEEVWHFLEMHQYLVPLLMEAHSHIRKYFPTADLILEYAADPEVAGEEQLILSIAAEQDADEAINVLMQLDYNWWFDANSQACNNLCITIGY